MAEKPVAGQPAGLTLGSLSKLPIGARIAIGVLLSSLVGLVYWFFFYAEISQQIAAQGKVAANLRAELAGQQQAQARYFADRDELTLRQQRQREFNKVLPAETEVAGFLSSIQAVANSSGIQLDAWQPLEERAEQFYARVPMSLQIAGRFHQIVKFSYELGKLDRVTNLENIDVTGVTQNGDDLILKVRCLATAFHALKPAPAPGAKP
jgi:type IV pilus assembly protein PilO